MYKIMIVEDEPVFREGLRNNIDWAANGIEIAAEAPNGLEALRLLDFVQPDVVLSDILMPEMDGLALAEEIRKRYPFTKVIMLTVMDGFHETRRSLRAQVSDYVLKFNYREELLAAVLKACRMLERERIALSETPNGYNDTVNFLRGCLLGNLTSEEIAHALQCEYSHLAGLQCTVAIGTFPNADPVAETALYLELQCELKRLGVSGIKSYVLSLGQRDCLILLTTGGSEEDLMQYGRRVMQNLRHAGKIYEAVHIGVGEIKPSLLQLTDAYGEAEVALGMAHLTQAGLLFHFNLHRDSYQILMQRAAEYIESHYFQPDLSLREVSEQFFLSPSYFSTIFKRAFGMGFNEYLTQVRLGHATKLLETGTMKMYEIAEQVGYTSPQYLSVLFKRHFSISPSDYRQQCQSGGQIGRPKNAAVP